MDAQILPGLHFTSTAPQYKILPQKTRGKRSISLYVFGTRYNMPVIYKNRIIKHRRPILQRGLLSSR
jgi:hypothetical protein